MTAAAALLALLALVEAPSPAQRAAAELKGLPRCAAAPAAAPKDWKRVPVRDGFSIALPACFAPAAEQPRFMHGGMVWLCKAPDVTVSNVTVSWGMWSQSSFTDPDKRCAATIGGLPALVMTSPDETRIWYLTGTVHEPVVSVWNKTPAELEELQPIAWSGQVEAAPAK